MYSLVSYLVCLLLFLHTVTNGYANTCLHCVAQGEERLCDDAAEILECNEELAEKYLSLFMRVNENLDVEGVDKTQFKCFKFYILGEEQFHLKGCTYGSLPICDKLTDNMGCSSCEGKDCNAQYYESYIDDDDDGGRAGTQVSSIGLIATCVLIIGLFRCAVVR